MKARSHWLPWLALAVGVSCGGMGGWRLHQHQQAQVMQGLQRSADGAALALEQRLDQYSDALAQLARQMQDGADAGQHAFAQYAHHLLSQRHLTGLQTLTLTRPVQAATQADAARRQAFEISYVWPLLGNEALLGSNSRHPVAAYDSLLATWHSRQMTVSAPFNLVQLEDSTRGVLLRFPLETPSAFRQEKNASRAPLMGMVNASVRLGDLAQGLVPAEFYPHTAMRIVDHGRTDGQAQVPQRADETLFTGNLWAKSQSRSSSEFEKGPLVERQIRVHDHIWTMQFRPSLSAKNWVDQAMPWLVFAAGWLVGAVLAAWASGWLQSRWAWLRRLKSNSLAKQESEARFQALCEQAALGMLQIDLGTRSVVQVNPHFSQISGYSEREVLHCNALEMLMPEDRVHCAEIMTDFSKARFRHNAGEFRLRTKAGSAVWVELNAFISGPEHARRLLVLVQNISGRKRLEYMERQGHQQLRNVMERLPVGLVMEDPEGRFVYWNEEFIRLAGDCAKPDVHRQSWWERMIPDAAERERVLHHWQRSLAKVRDAAAADGNEPGNIASSVSAMQEIQLLGADGVRRPVLLSGVLQPEGCLMVLQDQSQRAAAEQEIKRLAFYDALTGMPNRRLLTDRLQQALVAAERRQVFGGIALLDVDNFKAFNEAYGLEQGDRLLLELSHRLAALLPAGATIARQGGDDFVVLLDDLGSDSVAAATRLGQDALQWLARLQEPVEIAGKKLQMTVSMGLSLFGGAQLTHEEVLRRAEAAMYQAKAQGRNQICFYDPQLQLALQERRALEQDMREGLQSGQFELFFQAQVEMGRVIGAEALLRWNHPQKGYVSPEQFIALAEETGFILPLGKWVLESACRQLAVWARHPRFAQLQLAVNVSPRQFQQQGFVDQVLKALAQQGGDAKKLKLELTEGMLVADVEDTIAKMARLKSYGIGFALDDFGTGYSSLAYLKRLPLDQLKIDRSFVRDVLADPNDAAIARTVVALAKSLNLQVIAEGVETLAQCRFLESVRCYAWHGYLMSPPVPLAAFEELVMRGNVPGAAAPMLSPSPMR